VQTKDNNVRQLCATAVSNFSPKLQQRKFIRFSESKIWQSTGQKCCLQSENVALPLNNKFAGIRVLVCLVRSLEPWPRKLPSHGLQDTPDKHII